MNLEENPLSSCFNFNSKIHEVQYSVLGRLHLTLCLIFIFPSFYFLPPSLPIFTVNILYLLIYQSTTCSTSRTYVRYFADQPLDAHMTESSLSFFLSYLNLIILHIIYTELICTYIRVRRSWYGCTYVWQSLHLCRLKKWSLFHEFSEN